MSEFDSLGLAGVFWPYDAEAETAWLRPIDWRQHARHYSLHLDCIAAPMFKELEEQHEAMMRCLTNQRPETNTARAQRIAAEVRARRPEMQVKRITLEETN